MIDARMMPGFCLIEPRDETPSTTLIMPERVDLRSMYGLVVNVGESDYPVGFEAMDWVVFDRRHASELLVDDKTYCVTRHDHVMAVWE